MTTANGTTITPTTLLLRRAVLLLREVSLVSAVISAATEGEMTQMTPDSFLFSPLFSDESRFSSLSFLFLDPRPADDIPQNHLRYHK